MGVNKTSFTEKIKKYIRNFILNIESFLFILTLLLKRKALI